MSQGADYILKTYRRTRKAFIIEYTCAAILILLVLAFIISGTVLPNFIYWVVVIIVILILSWTELSRAFVRYNITPGKLVIINGIIQQKKKNVYFHPLAYVPDINLHQSRLQRILNYGSIFVSGDQSETFQVKDVDSPKKVLEFIEEMIEKNKPNHGAPPQQ